MRPLLSTPSLGITGEESRPRWPRSWEPAFNSLSRDHRESSRRDRRCGRFPLSTPSLGITAFGRSLRGALTTRRIGTFNSLSRDHRHLLDHQSIGLVTDFQLPLSGSRGNPSKSALKAREQATFNSLSRDHFPSRAELLMEVSKAFQLPLSGSPVIADPARRRRRARLSTPSLGITEPDSGIFRLSAASCRGAPSHK